MDTLQQPAPTPAPKRTYKALALILTALLALLIAVGILGYATGYIKIAVPVATQSVADKAVGTKCQSLIAGYNTAFSSEEDADYKQAINTAAEKAAKVTGGEQDATCLYIRFTDAVVDQNATLATQLAATLESLSEKGQYISGQLANPMGVDSIKATAQLLSAGDTQEASGGGEGNG